MATLLHITVPTSRFDAVESGYQVEINSNAAPENLSDSILRNAGFPTGEAWSIKWDNGSGPVDSWESIRAGQFIGSVLHASESGGWDVMGKVVVDVTPGK